MADAVQFVDITKIKVLNRTREDFGDMEGLIESIKDKGVLQPLLLNNKLQLRDGGRRYEAALRAGVKKVPALIRTDADDLDAIEVELICNLIRKDFTPAEQARHTKKLFDHCAAKNIDFSGRKLARMLDKSQKTVQRQLYIAEHLEQIPELGTLKTQDEIEKAIKKLHETAAVGELRRRQETSQSRGMVDMLKIAKANYRIGDCFKGMAELKTGGMIHFIELDPPYAVDLVTLREKKQGGADDKTKKYQEIPLKEYTTFMERMARETFRVASAHAWMICWFGNMNYHLVDSALRKGGWSVGAVPGIWAKPSGQTAAPEYNLANSYEPFFICRKGQPVLTKHGRSNIFSFPQVPHGEKYHPTERPAELIVELLETFCLPRSIVLVPCLGSGKTLRAAYLYGASAFGWDISNEYLDRFLLGVESDTKKLDEE